MRREQAVILADVLEELPAYYRDVFIQRNLEGTPFEVIAARIGRTPKAARIYWGPRNRARYRG